MENGEQSVMMAGTQMMPLLFVDSLGTQWYRGPTAVLTLAEVVVQFGLMTCSAAVKRKVSSTVGT